MSGVSVVLHEPRHGNEDVRRADLRDLLDERPVVEVVVLRIEPESDAAEVLRQRGNRRRYAGPRACGGGLALLVRGLEFVFVATRGFFEAEARESFLQERRREQRPVVEDDVREERAVGQATRPLESIVTFLPFVNASARARAVSPRCESTVPSETTSGA
jgi:hypothetical protein